MYMVNSNFGGTFKIVNSIVWRQGVGRVRLSGTEMMWFHFTNSWHLIFSLTLPFSIDLFHLLFRVNAQLLSWISNRANGGYAKRRKCEKENSMGQFFCEDETDGVLVRPSKKRNSIFDVCAMCDVYGKIAWIAFVCSFTKSRHSYFNGTIFDPFSRCTAVTLIFRCWRF